MSDNNDYKCPKCDLVCTSLTAYHKHYLREHDSQRVVWIEGRKPDRNWETVEDMREVG